MSGPSVVDLPPAKRIKLDNQKEDDTMGGKKKKGVAMLLLILLMDLLTESRAMKPEGDLNHH